MDLGEEDHRGNVPSLSHPIKGRANQHEITVGVDFDPSCVLPEQMEKQSCHLLSGNSESGAVIFF